MQLSSQPRGVEVDLGHVNEAFRFGCGTRAPKAE